jgi:hypothetical protein
VVILNSYDFIFIFVCDDYWRAAKIPALGKGSCMGRSVGAAVANGGKPSFLAMKG